MKKIKLLFLIFFIFSNNTYSIGFLNRRADIARLGIYADTNFFYINFPSGGPYIYCEGGYSYKGYTDLALDTSGNIFIADYNTHVIRKYTVSTGEYSVICGNGTGGDGGLAINATILVPSSITLDKNGNVYFIERHYGKIRKIDKITGVISTYLSFSEGAEGHGLKFDKNENLHFVAAGKVYKIDKITKEYSVVAGGGTLVNSDGGLAINAKMGIMGIAFDSSNNLFVGDELNKRIRKIDSRTGIITTYAGATPISINKDSVLAKNLKIIKPRALQFDSDNNLWFTDEETGLLEKISALDSTAYIAKDIVYGSCSWKPQGFVIDPKSDNIYVATMKTAHLWRLSFNPINVPTPTGSPMRFFCQYTPADTMAVDGVNLKWYKTSMGGTSFPSPFILNTDRTDTSVYFVSQTIGAIESDRFPVEVYIFRAPEKPILKSPTDYCLGDTTARLDVEVEELKLINWFNDSTLNNVAIPKPVINPNIKGSNQYYVRAFDGSTYCYSKPLAITIGIHQPDIPEFNADIDVCQNKTINVLEAKGENIRWYSNLINDTGTSIAPKPSSDKIGQTIFYLTQTDSFGCTSDTGKIIVTVNPVPAAPQVKSQNIYCQKDSALKLEAIGENMRWYGQDSLLIGSTTPIPSTLIAGKFIHYVSQTNAFNCESDLSKITTTINPKPSIESTIDVLTPRTGFPINLTASSDFGRQYLWNTSEITKNINYLPTQKGSLKFWVVSVSQDGCISDTSQHEIYVDADYYWKGKIDIYPNPFTDYIKVTGLNLSDIRSINLFTVDGKLVAQSEIPIQSYVLRIPQNLPSGHYIVEINTVGMANPSKLIYKQ